MDEEPPVYIGVNLPAKQGVSNQHVVDAALAQGYDLITARISSRHYRKRVQTLYTETLSDIEAPMVPPPMGEDLVVLPGPHVSNTIALCAPWAELDSKDTRLADISFQVLQHEFAYAKFCGLPYVVLEGPKRRTHLARYAHSLAKLLRRFPELKVVAHTTFTEEFRDNQPPPDLLSTWEVWDGVRLMCDHPPNLYVALEVQLARIPSFVVSRWFCEPVAMLILSEARAFVPNPKHYPVLPKHTQLFVKRLAQLKPFVLIKENLGPQKTVEFAGGDDACLIYLRNMLARAGSQSPPNPRTSYASQTSHCSQQSKQSRASRHVDAELDFDLRELDSLHLHTNQEQALEEYADVLQAPLQPLHDPLDSSVYEVFENDTVKYAQYYRAVFAALQSLSGPLGSDATASVKASQISSPLMLAVVGAGRGALVDRVIDACLAAGVGAKRPVRVYAVEKNAGAVAYLHARKASEPVWDSVEIVHADMRTWVPQSPCHIIVSELLGSLGDNELSPECLTAIEQSPQVLLPDVGIMIPKSYTAYVAPVFCPNVWSKARRRQAASPGAGLETPYVVRLNQAELLADPQPLWTFEHPACPSNPRQRYAKLSFAVASRARVYGLAGYFEAVLFPGIELSTNPVTQQAKSPGLVSWFPMLFPLKQPLDVCSETVIDTSIWRETADSRIWYEWAIETYDRKRCQRIRSGMTSIHNADGTAQSLHT